MPASKRLGALLASEEAWWNREWAEQLTKIIRKVGDGWYTKEDPWVGPRDRSWPAWKPGGPSWESAAWRAMGPRLDDREWLTELYRKIALGAMELHMPECLRGGYAHRSVLRRAPDVPLSPFQSTPAERLALDRFKVAVRWLEMARGIPDREIERLDGLFEEGPRPGPGLERRFDLGELQTFLRTAEYAGGPRLEGEDAARWDAAYHAAATLSAFPSVGRFRLGTTEPVKERFGRERAAAWLLGVLTASPGTP